MEGVPPLKVTGHVSLVASGAFARLLPAVAVIPCRDIILHRRNFIHCKDISLFTKCRLNMLFITFRDISLRKQFFIANSKFRGYSYVALLLKGI